MAFTIPQPPEALTEHEQGIVLVKSTPPQPLVLYYILAGLTAIGGFIMGWIYLVKDGGANKLFGLRAMALGLLLPLLLVIAIFVSQAIQKRASAPLPQQPGVLLPE
jgi:hypothetical protein